MSLKISTLTISFILFTLTSFAQKNFYQLSVGAGAGTTVAFADLDKKTFAFAAYGVVDYYITPYFSIGLELQKGELAGGDITTDKNHRQFINSYLAGTGNIKLQLGEFLNRYQLQSVFLNSIKGLYTGIGFGYIKNKISNVRYYGDAFFPGADNSVEGLVPINVGINFNIPDQWGYTRLVINANLQTSIAIGEGMDGYGHSVPEHNDLYGFYSVGLRYNFGIVGLDRRR